MADNVEKVEYQYTGDTSSLKKATTSAIQLLSKYSDSMKKASQSDTFRASQRSTTSMNAAINKLAKDITKVEGKLKKVGDVPLPKSSNISKTFQGALETIDAQMKKLSSSEKITTKVLSSMRAELKGVQSTLSSTNPQIDKYIASELRLQRVTEMATRAGTRLRTGFSEIKSRMTNVFEPVTNKLKTFGTSLTTITSKMQSFKDKAVTAFSRVSRQVSTVAAAFRRAVMGSKEVDDSTKKASSSHKSLSTVLTNLAAKFKTEKKAVDDEKKSLDSKNGTLKKSRDEHGLLTRALSKLGSAFKKETSKAKSYFSTLKSGTDASKLFSRASQALIGMSFADAFEQGTKSAIDYIENQNLFNVAMGASVEVGEAFVRQMQEVYGMDPNNLYRYAGYFYQLTDAIGMSSNASQIMSLSLTKASNDIASLFNVDIETVVENLSSGMMGMSRAVKKYGMDIRVTTLQATALKYGLKGDVDTMSEANRQALRFITMMEQAQNALQQTSKAVEGSNEIMGDFANTIESPANQLRILKEQLAQLGRAIGNFILVPISKALAYINGLIMALRMVLEFVGSLVGILTANQDAIDSGTEGATDGIDSIGSAADATKKKLKDMVAPFDELNILQEEMSDDSSVGDLNGDIDPKLLEAISNMELQLENIKMKANQIRDSILEFFGFEVKDGTIVSWDESVFWPSLDELDAGAERTAKALAEKLNAAINKLPSRDVGKAIGKFLQAGLTFTVTFLDTVDFSNISKKVSETLLSALAEIDFKNIGKLLVFKYKLFIEIVDGLLDAMDASYGTYATGWDMLGNKLADGVMGALESIDWAKAGMNFSRLAIGLLESLILAISKIDWAKVGASIAEFINNIDWSKLLKTLLHAIWEISKALGTALVSLWENGDPETKAILAALGVYGLAKAFKPLLSKVLDVTDAYKKKNRALDEQTQLEEQEAEALAYSLVPQLGFAADGATVFGRNTESATSSVFGSLPAFGMAASALTGLATTTDTATTSSINLTASQYGLTDQTKDLNASTELLATTADKTYTGIENASVKMYSAKYNVGQLTDAVYESAGMNVAFAGLTEQAYGNVQVAAENLDASPVNSYSDAVTSACSKMTSAINGVADAYVELQNLMGGSTTPAKSNAPKSTQPETAPMMGGMPVYEEGKEPRPGDLPEGTKIIIHSADGRYKIMKGFHSDIDRYKADGGYWMWQEDYGSSGAQKDTSISPELYSSSSGITRKDVSKFGWNLLEAFVTVGLPMMTGVPALASGGVVTGPTLSLVGEGAYDEAIIPLGNSPQMHEFAQEVASTVMRNTASSEPVEVRVFIGDREWDAFTYKSAERGKRLVGAQPIKEGT